MTSLAFRELRYGADSELQTVSLWELPVAERVPPDRANRYWLVYIHGGAWRDPRCLADTALPGMDRLLAQGPAVRRRIAGFASLGYRLSPHPQFPQDPATTPPAQLRAARHPEHLQDVWAGLAALAGDGNQGTVGSPADYLGAGRYIVYGHSCGAFLAFQLWMGARSSLPSVPLLRPPVVVGLEGIYDLRTYVERAGGAGADPGLGPVLAEIAEGAFGRDRAAWDAASPGHFDWSTTTATTAPTLPTGRRLAVLAYSPEDELVDGGEIDTMEAALRKGADAGTGAGAGAGANAGLRVLALRDLHGKHDEVREDGREVARVLVATLAALDA